MLFKMLLLNIFNMMPYSLHLSSVFFFFFFFNDTPTPEISPLSLHDALPIFLALDRELLMVAAGGAQAALRQQLQQHAAELAIAPGPQISAPRHHEPKSAAMASSAACC